MRAVPVSRYIAFFSIAIAGCAADLATKAWIFGRLGFPDGQVWWIAEDVFGFQTSLNLGALFGMGQGFSMALAILSVIAGLGILGWLFLGGAARSWLMTVALGCISAGILGNLYDRLGLPGLTWPYSDPHGLFTVGEPVYAVRDWILVMIGKWPWPSFNIADSLLVCGAGALILHAFWGSSDPESDKVGSVHKL